jgi:hypothetical protein
MKFKDLYLKLKRFIKRKLRNRQLRKRDPFIY